MSQSDEGGLLKQSPSRYHLPAWFLERNVKAPSDLKGYVCICQCKACEDYKKLYEDEETEDQTARSESATDDPQPEREPHTSAEHHEHHNRDAISYKNFSELRDMVATVMLWRHMRPQDSSVLFRRCCASGCSSCPMEPVHMDDIVGQVARSLGTGLISLSFEDLEELGSEFHAQDRGCVAGGTKEKTSTAEGGSAACEAPKEMPSPAEPSEGEGPTTETTPDGGAKNHNTEGAPDEATAPKELVKDGWKADWSDLATFTDHFFAARSKKWQDDAGLSYSAWRDRAKESYATILDGVSVKTGQAGKTKLSETREGENGASASRGILVHFIDCDHSGSTLEYRQKRRILVRLGELVQERRRGGQAIALVISSRTLEAGEKLCRKAGVSTFSEVTLSIVNPSTQGAEDRGRRRKGDINTRRLRWTLETGMAQPAGARPNMEWLQGANGADIARYGRELWSVNNIHRAAGQIMARTWLKSQSVITSKHVNSVLRRMGLLISPKPTKKTDKKEDSGDPQTASDEVVEEADENPLDNISLDDHEERFRDCVIKPKDLDVSWDDVILDRDTKELIQNLVPSSRLEVEACSDFLLSQLRIRGCLLYGPPGTGKTHLCRAIAASSGSRMLSIDYATTQSSMVGRAEKYIHAAFTLAAKLHPCVLFVDEADALFYRRSSGERGWERSATTQFLVEMDGLAQNPAAPLVVVATNRPWDLDEAFLRRLPQKFLIGLPDRDSRAAILRLFLRDGDLDPAVDVGGVAAATAGFSGSDLRSLCAEAALLWKAEQVRLDRLCGAVSPAFATARGGPRRRLRLDVDHFAAAFEKMQPSRARGAADELERFSRRYNPVQGGLGRGNGGKRYIFNEASGRNEALSVRELISRPVPAEEGSPAGMQLVVWRSAEEVLFPGKASTQVGETASPTPVSSPDGQVSQEGTATRGDDEQSEDQENGLTEPEAQSVEIVPCAELDIEKPHTTPDHQILCSTDTSPTGCEAMSGSRGPESTGTDPPRATSSAPQAQTMKSGADVDLVPLLVTLAAVFWYS